METWLAAHPAAASLQAFAPQASLDQRLAVCLLDTIDVTVRQSPAWSAHRRWLASVPGLTEALAARASWRNHPARNRVEAVARTLEAVGVKETNRIDHQTFVIAVEWLWRRWRARGQRFPFRSKPFFPERGAERFAVPAYRDDSLTPQEMRTAIGFGLGRDGAAFLLHALERALRRRVDIDDLSDVMLLPKAEGKFTGVFRLTVEFRDGRLAADLAVHAAKNEPASDVLADEYRALAQCHMDAPGCAPEPYLFGYTSVQRGEQTRRIGFLLEEWLDGYDELHIRPDENGDRFIIWHATDAHEKLTDEESDRVREEIARLLTRGSDLEHGRTIVTELTWVNGGDFACRRMDGRLEVRMTALRRIDEGIDVPTFLHRLLNLHAVDAESSPGQPVRVPVLSPACAFRGLRRGLVERYGRTRGRRLAREWLTALAGTGFVGMTP
ncbi:MAG: hypothetical protein HY710_06880 [Candidatus Latescibacteria bacterium]|nr:hypothetical protein [Candidatus Latescibacterota bacterium]